MKEQQQNVAKFEMFSFIFSIRKILRKKAQVFQHNLHEFRAFAVQRSTI